MVLYNKSPSKEVLKDLKLSIIVPVYNVQAYLADCLNSIIYPGLADYEIVVVNDGSTDDSGRIAAEFAQKYPELITLINSENGGLGAARNLGMSRAQGEYVQFLDSDDRLNENAVPEMLEAIESGYDIYLFDFVCVNAEGEIIERMSGCSKEGALSLESCPELLMQLPSGCNKICRRSLFTETGISFPARVWYEDLRTMPKLYLHTDKIFAVKKPWYVYLLRQGSITNSAKLARNLEIIDAAEDLLGYYKDHGRYETYKAQLDYIAFYNQFLTASVRVAAVDSNSPVIKQLRDSFLKSHPDYNENSYISSMPMKHRLLTFLFMHSLNGCAAFLMKLRARSKGRDF